MHPLTLGFLELLAPTHCPGCDTPLPWRQEGFCTVCAPLLERRKSGPGAYEFGGPMADAVRRFKYAGRLDLARPLARLMVPALRRWEGSDLVISFIPLHKTRLRQRGYDQAQLLARELSKHLELPLQPTLERARFRSPQAVLSEKARATNIRGAFKSLPDTPKRIVLIDDVWTTGSTLTEARRVLKESGAELVVLRTLATVPE